MRKKVKRKRKTDVENRTQAAWNRTQPPENRTQPPENRTQEPQNKAQSQNNASNGACPCPSSWDDAQAIPGSPSCESTKSLSAPFQQAGSTARHVSLRRHIRTPSTERNPPSKRVGLVGSHRECPQIHALFVSSPHSSAKFTATTLIQLGTKNTDQSLHKSGKLAPYASETRILAWSTRVRLVRTPRASTYESRRPVLAQNPAESRRIGAKEAGPVPIFLAPLSSTGETKCRGWVWEPASGCQALPATFWSIWRQKCVPISAFLSRLAHSVSESAHLMP